MWVSEAQLEPITGTEAPPNPWGDTPKWDTLAALCGVRMNSSAFVLDFKTP
jgi:hypothetical protein